MGSRGGSLWCLRGGMPTRSPSCPAIGAMCACPRRDGAEKEVFFARRGGLCCLRAWVPTRSPCCPAIGAMCACPRRDGAENDISFARRGGLLVWCGTASVLGCRLGRPPAPPSGPCAL